MAREKCLANPQVVKNQGNRIKIREEKYRIHHADMMVANRSIQICIPEVIKIS